MTTAHRKSAFSLAEVMVALCFLTIAVFGLISVLAYTVKAGQKNQDLAQAVTRASSEMNRIESMLRADLGTAVDCNRTPLPGGYQLTVVKTVLQSNLGVPELVQVDLSILWRDAQGPQHYDVWSRYSRH